MSHTRIDCDMMETTCKRNQQPSRTESRLGLDCVHAICQAKVNIMGVGAYLGEGRCAI